MRNGFYNYLKFSGTVKVVGVITKNPCLGRGIIEFNLTPMN